MASPPSPRPRRPRPVADAPVDALVAQAETVAKGWLLEVLDAGPLAAAAALPAAEFAREAPALCAAVARALASDDELDRLRPGGDMHVAAAAAGLLAGALEPAPTAAVLAALRAVMWAAIEAELAAPDAAQVSDLAVRLAHVMQELTALALSGSDGLAATGHGWRDLLDERMGDAGETFTLLLVEVDAADKLEASEGTDAAARLLASASDAVRAALRPDDVVTEETGARFWVLAPGIDRPAAAALGARLGWAVEDAVEVNGASLTATVGLAVHPGDARDPGSLLARAEEALYSARAAGVRVGGAEGDPEPERRGGPRLVR